MFTVLTCGKGWGGGKEQAKVTCSVVKLWNLVSRSTVDIAVFKKPLSS